MNRAKNVIQNSSFIIGLLCMLAFMSSGFAACVIASQGQLMFPFILFILAPLPFGLVFAVLSNKLIHTPKNLHRTLSFVVLSISLVLVTVLCALLLAWLGYVGVFRNNFFL